MTQQTEAQRATSQYGAERVDHARLEELEEQYRQALAAGFAPEPTAVAFGARVVDLGADNFRRERAEWDAMPGLEALQQFGARVAQENRQSTDPFPVRELQMLEDGRFTRGKNAMHPTSHVFKALVKRTSCPEPSAAATYLSILHPARRAEEFNHWAAATSEEHTVVLRHRRMLDVGRGREVFAAVSEKYSAVDADEVAAVLARVAPGDCRVEVLYDGRTASVTLHYMTDVQPERLCAGEFFRAAAGFRTRDDGTRSIRPFAGLHRNLCLNLIIVDRGKLSLPVRHVGRGDRVATEMAAALKASVDKIRWFVDRWDTIRTRRLDSPQVVRGLSDDDALRTDAKIAAGVFRGLLADERVGLPGLRRPAAQAELMRAWAVEPEPTVAGVVNAVSRAAHEAALSGPWASEEVERMAGELAGADRPLRWADDQGF